METCEISRILQRKLPKSVFKGVVSADNFPKPPSGNDVFCFVSNTDCICNEGTHWIAFYRDQYGVGHYFDSFGMKPINNHKDIWIKYFQKVSPYGVEYYNRRIQNIISDNCGQFCIYYLIKRYSHDPSVISDNMLMDKVTDDVVVRYVNRIKK